MNQSKLESLEEIVLNTVTGFFISLGVQMLVFPLYGIKISTGQNFTLTIIFTIVSIIRGYCFRRIYNRRKGTLIGFVLKQYRKLHER